MTPSLAEKQCLNIIDQQLQKIKSGHLVIELPDGNQKHYGDNSSPLILKVNRYRFFSRLLAAGNIGMGEAWTDNDWDSDSLTGILELFIHNMEELKASGLTAGMAKRFQHLLQHARNRNTIDGSKRNIHAHYDLGNNFYECFLDQKTMMYSSALFETHDAPLADAQICKIHRVAELAEITKEHHVLEIGCGWGGFAIEAAKSTGCKVTGITISEEQFNYAVQRVKEEGLEQQIKIIMTDYREVEGSFDRIVSIEMLEAVGHAFYGTFFKTCDDLLKKGGKAVLQVICIPDQRYDAYRHNPDWIQKHIFPGGMLPALNELTKAMTTRSSLIVDHLDNIGVDYAETLRRWRHAFCEKSKELEEMGYDPTFQRKWIYYLCYCEAGFQTRFINNLHLVLTRPEEPMS